MVNIYPVQKSEISCSDYRIRVNGMEAAPDTARVSAYPFNRRWPGHQRDKSQTELVNFLSLSFDEPVTFEIIPAQPFDSVAIRPQSLGITPEVKDGVIRFTLDKPEYLTVEPFGRQHALHIFADPVKTYRADGDVIYFGAGVHEAGIIDIKSGQTLFLDEGALVYGAVVANHADNIRIIGHGILDNSHQKEKILWEANAVGNTSAVDNATRENAIKFEYCHGIEIDGITIRDSLLYNIRPICCNDISIRNVKIIGCWRYNSDGIDMHNCQNVEIADCFVRTYDDCICVKGFDCWQKTEEILANPRAIDTFRNVRVRGCTLWNDWGKCLEIGAETRAEEICDIVFEDCRVIHVTGSVLDCMNVDWADVHDVTWRNIDVEFDDEILTPLIQKSDDAVYANYNPDYAPVLILAEIVFHHEFSDGGQKRGRVRNLRFEEIRLTGRQKPRIWFVGYDETHKCENIAIAGLYHNGERLQSLPPEQFEMNGYCDNIRIE